MRELLTKIWFELFKLIEPDKFDNVGNNKSDKNKIILMLTYIYEHYYENISIKDIAKAAYLSERECYRLFKNKLKSTPSTEIKNYRLQQACRMLAATSDSITEISCCCGFNSPSYFSKIFYEALKCSPSEYRENGRNLTKNGIKITV